MTPGPAPAVVDEERPVAPRSGGARLLLAGIGLYQAIRSGKPSPCRYLPTCSAYATDAVSTHGATRGGWLALRRVLRCHPFGAHGLDPVPPPRAAAMRGEP
ncbi:MAG TPA: membrane protein insertion efficiency factor YidD [Acidimicrobiales bacterium]|nr:membrane protein insertion efficiency factor YidD [Acidimicrobiales bacterium]